VCSSVSYENLLQIFGEITVGLQTICIRIPAVTLSDALPSDAHRLQKRNSLGYVRSLGSCPQRCDPKVLANQEDISFIRGHPCRPCHSAAGTALVRASTIHRNLKAASWPGHERTTREFLLAARGSSNVVSSIKSNKMFSSSTSADSCEEC
jgi:hypothetical protein